MFPGVISASESGIRIPSLVDDAEFYSDNVVVAENARYFDRIWLPGREEPVFGNLFPLPVTGCRNRAGFEGDIPQSVIVVPPDRLPAQAAPADPELDFVAVRVGVNFQGVLIPPLPVPVVGYVARTPIEIAVGPWRTPIWTTGSSDQ